MHPFHKNIIFIGVLLMIIMTSTTLLRNRVAEGVDYSYGSGFIIPKSNPDGEYLGGILNFPQPFVSGRTGKLTGAGTLCSKESCLTEKCKQEWEEKSMEAQSKIEAEKIPVLRPDHPGNSACLARPECIQNHRKSMEAKKSRALLFLNEEKCKAYYYKNILLKISIVLFGIILQGFMLKSISKGKLYLITVLYVVIMTVIYFMIAIGIEMGQGFKEDILSKIFEYWITYFNPLLTVYIILCYIYYKFFKRRTFHYYQ